MVSGDRWWRTWRVGDRRVITRVLLAAVGLVVVGRVGPAVSVWTRWFAVWVLVLAGLMVVAVTTGAVRMAVGDGKASWGQGLVASTLLGMATDQVRVDWRPVGTTVATVGVVVVASFLPWQAWWLMTTTGIMVIGGVLFGMVVNRAHHREWRWWLA